MNNVAPIPWNEQGEFWEEFDAFDMVVDTLELGSSCDLPGAVAQCGILGNRVSCSPAALCRCFIETLVPKGVSAGAERGRSSS